MANIPFNKHLRLSRWYADWLHSTGNDHSHSDAEVDMYYQAFIAGVGCVATTQTIDNAYANEADDRQ